MEDGTEEDDLQSNATPKFQLRTPDDDEIVTSGSSRYNRRSSVLTDPGADDRWPGTIDTRRPSTNTIILPKLSESEEDDRLEDFLSPDHSVPDSRNNSLLDSLLEPLTAVRSRSTTNRPLIPYDLVELSQSMGVEAYNSNGALARDPSRDTRLTAEHSTILYDDDLEEILQIALETAIKVFAVDLHESVDISDDDGMATRFLAEVKSASLSNVAVRDGVSRDHKRAFSSSTAVSVPQRTRKAPDEMADLARLTVESSRKPTTGRSYKKMFASYPLQSHIRSVGVVNDEELSIRHPVEEGSLSAGTRDLHRDVSQYFDLATVKKKSESCPIRQLPESGHIELSIPVKQRSLSQMLDNAKPVSQDRVRKPTTLQPTAPIHHYTAPTTTVGDFPTVSAKPGKSARLADSASTGHNDSNFQYDQQQEEKEDEPGICELEVKNAIKTLKAVAGEVGSSGATDEPAAQMVIDYINRLLEKVQNYPHGVTGPSYNRQEHNRPNSNRRSYNTPSSNRHEHNESSYNEPSYSGPSYDGPSYNGFSYNTPNSNGQSYNTPSYNRLGYNGPSYNGPSQRGQNYNGQNYNTPSSNRQGYKEQSYNRQNYNTHSPNGQNYNGRTSNEPSSKYQSYNELSYRGHSHNRPQFSVAVDTSHQDTPSPEQQQEAPFTRYDMERARDYMCRLIENVMSRAPSAKTSAETMTTPDIDQTSVAVDAWQGLQRDAPSGLSKNNQPNVQQKATVEDDKFANQKSISERPVDKKSASESSMGTISTVEKSMGENFMEERSMGQKSVGESSTGDSKGSMHLHLHIYNKAAADYSVGRQPAISVAPQDTESVKTAEFLCNDEVEFSRRTTQKETIGKPDNRRSELHTSRAQCKKLPIQPADGSPAVSELAETAVASDCVHQTPVKPCQHQVETREKSRRKDRSQSKTRRGRPHSPYRKAKCSCEKITKEPLEETDMQVVTIGSIDTCTKPILPLTPKKFNRYRAASSDLACKNDARSIVWNILHTEHTQIYSKGRPISDSLEFLKRCHPLTYNMSALDRYVFIYLYDLRYEEMCREQRDEVSFSSFASHYVLEPIGQLYRQLMFNDASDDILECEDGHNHDEICKARPFVEEPVHVERSRAGSKTNQSYDMLYFCL